MGNLPNFGWRSAIFPRTFSLLYPQPLRRGNRAKPLCFSNEKRCRRLRFGAVLFRWQRGNLKVQAACPLCDNGRLVLCVIRSGLSCFFVGSSSPFRLTMGELFFFSAGKRTVCLFLPFGSGKGKREKHSFFAQTKKRTIFLVFFGKFLKMPKKRDEFKKRG